MTLRERFEELHVPCPDELPGDMNALIKNGLKQGLILCIQTVKNEDGVVSNQWSFLNSKEGHVRE